MSASNSYEVKILDHILGTASLTSPATVYVALFTASDSTGNTLENLEQGILTNEVAGNGYSRQSITFGAASGGQAQGPSAGSVTFTASGGDWGEIVALAIMDKDQTDSAGDGEVIVYGSLATAKTVSDSDSLQFSTNSITVTLS